MCSLKTWFCSIYWSQSSTRNPDSWSRIHPTHRRLVHEVLESRTLLSVSPATADVSSASYSAIEKSGQDSALWSTVDTQETSSLVENNAVSARAVDEYFASTAQAKSAPGLRLLSLTSTDDESARLNIWVDGEEVEIPAEVGVYSDNSTAGAYTTDTDGEIYFDGDLETTLGDFFEIWRTDAGNAGNDEDATFDDDELMGYESDSNFTVQMFVNGEVRTNFENYAVQDGDEIILVYSDNPSFRSIPTTVQS